MKHTTLQLYGIDAKELSNMTYEDALIACQIGAKNQLRELMQYGFMERNEMLIMAVNKAIEFCYAKLEELK